jgi:hypothetical protein
MRGVRRPEAIQQRDSGGKNLSIVRHLKVLPPVQYPFFVLLPLDETLIFKRRARGD